MSDAFNPRRVLSMALSGLVLALVVSLIGGAAPAARASVAAAAPTTSPVSWRFDAQMGGSHAGAVHGWVSGTLDSTGVLTATVTSGELAPLTPGCAAYVDFGPSCGLPASANVSGKIQGGVASLVAKGKGWTWVLAGEQTAAAVAATTTTPAVSAALAGTLTSGSTVAGAWSLQPITSNVHIDGGFRSDPKSKHPVVLAGGIDLRVTADGWAIGTFSLANGAVPTVVTGFVNAAKSSVEVAIPMGKSGTILANGWSRPGFGALHWAGSFVGPGVGDYGTMKGLG